MSGRNLLLPRFDGSIGGPRPLKRDLYEEQRRDIRLSDCAMMPEYPEHSDAENANDSYLGRRCAGNSNKLHSSMRNARIMDCFSELYMLDSLLLTFLHQSSWVERSSSKSRDIAAVVLLLPRSRDETISALCEVASFY